ncbi:MAG: hypothetical protein RLY14_236 [Planctomycetota bacterium]|jgi:hypothetical protein
MSGDSNSTNTEDDFYWLKWCFFTGCMVLLFRFGLPTFLKEKKQEVTKATQEFISEFKSISDSEVATLRGLTPVQLRERLGKPDTVDIISSTPSQLLLRKPNSPPESENSVSEHWRYFRKVTHKSSGTKVDLKCIIKDGKCTTAEMF